MSFTASTDLNHYPSFNFVAEFLLDQEEQAYENVSAVAERICVGGVLKALWQGITVSIGVAGSLAGVITFIAQAVFESILTLAGQQELDIVELFQCNIIYPTSEAIHRIKQRFEYIYRVNQEESVLHDETNGSSRTSINVSSTDVEFRENKFGQLLPLVRPVPPISLFDTVILDKGVLQSAHGKAVVFEDDEIVKLINPIAHESFQPEIATITQKIKVFSDGKKMVQQQATRGCTAAVAQCLLSDLGINFDWESLNWCNLGGAETIFREINSHEGVECISRSVSSLEGLNAVISEYGPAYLSIHDPNAGSHAIVVDKVLGDRVQIREPYHGWRLWVTKEALLKRTSFGKGKSERVLFAVKAD